MRLHITLDDHLVKALDRRVGPRGRSRFIADGIRQALEDEQGWEDLEAVMGAVLEISGSRRVATRFLRLFPLP